MSRHNAVRYAVAGVLAVGLLAGCGGAGHIASAGSQAAKAKPGHAVSGAEAMVAQAPNDAAARVTLAQFYLSAGRFQSAATTFLDAVKLGDASGRTELSLALAQIGAGDVRSAVAVLDGARDSIPATDRGLALALAGETSRGVAILVDALRGGDNTPKLRQNLAYAFALNGQWREARVAMAQDVPGDQIDNRIGEWASMAQPEAIQQRVAALLGVPAGVADAGQPAELALVGTTNGEQMAAAQPVAQTAAAELPAIGEAPAAAAMPAPAPVGGEAPAAPAPAATGFADAFLPTPAPAQAAPQPGFISQPVVQAIPAAVVKPSPAAPASHIVQASRLAQPGHVMQQGRPAQPAHLAAARPAAPAAKPAPLAAGNHLVQLGSFSNEASARSAWRIFTTRNPELRDTRLTITPAVVNGKNFWRVAAGGIDGSAAQRICSSVRTRGGNCLAYGPGSAPAGAKPELAMAGAGPGKAHRR